MRVVAAPPARVRRRAAAGGAASREGLEFGRYEIFHRLHDDGRPLFSVASLREPGTFDPEAMAGTRSRASRCSRVLPGPLPASEAFDELIFTARALARTLGGTLQDERGAPLTVQRITPAARGSARVRAQRPGGAAD